MRTEIENVKKIMQEAAGKAKLYHENISRIRRTCKPEHIQAETKAFSEPLKQSMFQAAKEVEEALNGLESDLKAGIIIRGEDYDSATMAEINALKPDAAELTEIAKRYKGNETMLRALNQYNVKHDVGANIPVSGQSKVNAVNLLRGDISYIIKQAAEIDSDVNRYANWQLQHFAENFDTIFSDIIGTIGE